MITFSGTKNGKVRSVPITAELEAKIRAAHESERGGTLAQLRQWAARVHEWRYQCGPMTVVEPPKPWQKAGKRR